MYISTTCFATLPNHHKHALANDVSCHASGHATSSCMAMVRSTFLAPAQRVGVAILHINSLGATNMAGWKIVAHF